MVRVEINTVRNILRLTFSEVVGRTEVKQCRASVKSALAKLQPGFRVLTDLSALEEMHYSCAPAIEEIMDMCQQKGVAKVIRVIPDSKKDIGFNVMSLFHYSHDVPILTCKTIAEARKKLAS